MDGSAFGIHNSMISFMKENLNCYTPAICGGESFLLHWFMKEKKSLDYYVCESRFRQKLYIASVHKG